MKLYDNERLLIISNNVLSTTRNNGKTIFSYIDALPQENVAQLYFYTERPTIKGYSYYQITDKDIIRGMLSPEKRGRRIEASQAVPVAESVSKTVRRGIFFRLAREILWHRKWKSKRLLTWLDEFSPSAVFFVAGDSGFTYNIYKFIVNRYHPRASMYITDDYIMPRSEETFLQKYRRKRIKSKITNALTITHNFLTVSPVMQAEYLKVFGRDSQTIVNLSESLRLEHVHPQTEEMELLYAGSLYYGRDAVLGEIASAIAEFNKQSKTQKAVLKVYTNSEPDQQTKDRFVVEGTSEYSGSLTKEELRIALNQADVLVFVESFDKEQIEKTRYSLSTKVPEYLSVGKPILTVGPRHIGSVEHLLDVSCCVNDLNDLKERLLTLLGDASVRQKLAEAALEKYNRCHDKEKLQNEFMHSLFGEG